MAFIISKKSRQYGRMRLLYYLVENYRKDNKVKRRTLLHLHSHKSVAQLLNATEQEEAKQRDYVVSLERALNDLAETGKLPPLSYWPASRIKRNLEKQHYRARVKLMGWQVRKERIRAYVVP